MVAPDMRIRATMSAEVLLLVVVAFGFATMCFIGKSVERLLTEIRDELRKR